MSDDLLSELRRAAALVTDPDRIREASLDGRGRRQGRALAIVRPASAEETAEVLRICARHRARVIPQGGNTSNVEGATPSPDLTDHEAARTIVLQTHRLNRILEIDPVNNTAVVEAGVVLADLQRAAREAGRMFPLSLAAEGSARIGGVLATNAGGVHVLRYGSVRALVLGLEVVLADGRILNLMRALRKDNSGYDLRDLFLGSEGTLGVITKAILKLEPAPRARRTLCLALGCLADVETLFTRLEAHCGPALEAFEIIGRAPLETVLAAEGRTAPFELTDWTVLADICTYGDTPTERDDARETALEDLLMDLMASGTVTSGILSQSEADAQSLWALREGIPGAVKRAGGNVKHDVSVPRSRLVETIERTCALLSEHFPKCAPSIFGHYGDGNLHFNVGGVDSPAYAFEHEARIRRIVHDAVLAAGGSIAAEHGVGAMKVAELERTKDAVELDLMRALKRTLDPEGILNPGRVVRVAP